MSAERCYWEFDDCDRHGCEAVYVGVWSRYCPEHAATWRAEIERQDERDMPKLMGMQDWWRRMNARRAPVEA